jgi:hypothetical protein
MFGGGGAYLAISVEHKSQTKKGERRKIRRLPDM